MTRRDIKILYAVAAGIVTMTTSGEPELFVGDLRCCDQTAGPRLTRAGLIRPSSTASDRVPAVLTADGRAALDELAGQR